MSKKNKQNKGPEPKTGTSEGEGVADEPKGEGVADEPKGDGEGEGEGVAEPAKKSPLEIRLDALEAENKKLKLSNSKREEKEAEAKREKMTADEKRDADHEETKRKLEAQTATNVKMKKSAAIQKESTKAGGGARFSHIEKLIDLDTVTIEEDGTITGAAEAVALIKEEVPELFNQAKGSTSNPGSGAGKQSDKQKKQEPDDDYNIGKSLFKSEKKSRI